MRRISPMPHIRNLERADIKGLRRSLRGLGAIVAEVDRELRYVWIDNPHPDFAVEDVIGKRDNELISPPENAEDLMELKRQVFERKEPLSRILSFERSDGVRYYSILAYPIRSERGAFDAVFTVGFDALAMSRTTASALRPSAARE
jgi:PAS fold